MALPTSKDSVAGPSRENNKNDTVAANAQQISNQLHSLLTAALQTKPSVTISQLAGLLNFKVKSINKLTIESNLGYIQLHL